MKVDRASDAPHKDPGSCPEVENGTKRLLLSSYTPNKGISDNLSSSEHNGDFQRNSF
jgi:hypothetical protein